MLTQQNVFRVSAIIYAGKNYDVSPRQIHRRVIQDALYRLTDDFVGLGRLSEYIEENYSLLFSTDEIKSVVLDKRYQEEFDIKSSESDIICQLSEKRRISLSLHQKKTLQDYIILYLENNSICPNRGECIMQFLYNMFTNNVDSFKKLLQNRKINLEVNNNSVTAEDASVINGFLDWNDEDKNEEIFNLASYALEYCMLTGKKTSHVTLDYLKNKIFYLDTNILYRAIGINGEDRKKRTLLALSKFKSLNCKIKITKGTLDEFENSIKSYIKKLRKSETPAIRSAVYREYVITDDIWRYYHNWRAERSNETVEYFESYLMSGFFEICQKYEIVVDKDQPFSIEECEDELKANSASIRGLSEHKTLETAQYDAQNVKWVECKRNGADKSIFDAKVYLLSSDGGLRFWDAKYHSQYAPIVILPSQWLSIILRYMERTSDDFKSFVCFLNIKSTSAIMSEEQIHYVLQGISEVTTDLDQQSSLLRTIVENDFKNGAKDLSDLQIAQMSKKSAERMLQEKLDTEYERTASLSLAISEKEKEVANLQSQQEQFTIERELLEKEHSEESLKTTEEIKRLKEQLSKQNDEINEARISEQNYREKEFYRRKRNKLFLLALIIGVIAVHLIWYFVADSESTTYMGNVVRWVSSLDEMRLKCFTPVVCLIIGSVLIPLCVRFCKILKEKFDTKNSK